MEKRIKIGLTGMMVIFILIVGLYIIFKTQQKQLPTPQRIIDLCEKDRAFSESVRSNPECVDDWSCVDGWSTTVYYDRRLTNTTEFTFSLEKPKELINATIAQYGRSVCNCRTPISYHVLIEDELKGTTCESFYKFIKDYNSSCSGCVLTWGTECC